MNYFLKWHVLYLYHIDLSIYLSPYLLQHYNESIKQVPITWETASYHPMAEKFHGLPHSLFWGSYTVDTDWYQDLYTRMCIKYKRTGNHANGKTSVHTENVYCLQNCCSNVNTELQSVLWIKWGPLLQYPLSCGCLIFRWKGRGS